MSRSARLKTTSPVGTSSSTADTTNNENTPSSPHIVERRGRADGDVLSSPPREGTSLAHDLSKLFKTELNALVLITAGGGYAVTGGSLFEVSTLCGLLAGTMMCASAAATFNQLREHQFDRMMTRTRSRPLVTGAISLPAARAMAWSLAAGGVGLLAVTTNVTTAALGALTIVMYTHMYTPMKRVSPLNTELGALVGAVPPVMGWTAATGLSGVCTPEAAFLFATLYLWQMHHFMTIAWSRRLDYERAGFVMQSLDDGDGERTASKGLFYAASMIPLSYLAHLGGFVNPMFMVSGTVINGALLYSYLQFYRNRTTKQAKRTMKWGFLQLIAYMAAMVYHLRDRDDIRAFRELETMRTRGRDWCLYHGHQMWSFGHRACAYFFAGRKKEDDCTTTNVAASDGVNEGVNER